MIKLYTLFKKIGHALQSVFLNGLLTILPIATTIFVVHFAYSLVSRWIAPLKPLLPLSLQAIPGAEFMLVTILLIAIGTVLRFFFIHSFIQQGEDLIAKIPFIRTVYSSAKILLEFFNVSENSVDTKQVVLVEYPKQGTYNIAFLLESAVKNFQPLITDHTKEQKEYVKVFMPNSPNPTTGYFFILPKDEIIPTSISFEEAIKTVVSCGLITPESINQDKNRP